MGGTAKLYLLELDRTVIVSNDKVDPRGGPTEETWNNEKPLTRRTTVEARDSEPRRHPTPC